MRLLTLVLLLLSIQLQAQPPCSSPGTTPTTATVVCGSTVFNQPNLPSCNGINIPYPGCTGLVSDNAAFYSFHCYQAGTFGFLLTPVSPADDYDWAIMDITGFNPADIYTNNLNISVNLSGTPGPTGCTATGVGNSNCAGGTPQFNAMPMLQAGHDYLLMVSNWSSSGLGYNMTFSGGTTILGDNAAPVITSLSQVGCRTDQIRVQFSENILCSTATATGSEFTITTGTHTITGVVSQCATGVNAFTELIINLQSPLPTGNYNLVVANGTDGNIFNDVCNTPMSTTSFPFAVTAQPSPVVNNIFYNGCAPRILKVAMNKIVNCQSITAAGSEFSITPGNPAIASVQTVCNGSPAATDTIFIHLQNPLPFGSYQLNINNGSDGNTVVDTCGTSIPAAYTFPFTINQVTTAPTYDSVQYDRCLPNTIRVYYSDPILCSSVNSNGSEFTITGPAAVNITGASTDATCASGYTNWVSLTLSQPINTFGTFVLHNVAGNDGNSVTDTCYTPQNINETISFDVLGRPTAAFEDSIHRGCVNDTLVLTHPGGNGINSWQWTFSNGTVINGQNASQVFPVATANTSVQLIVSNGVCADTLTRSYTFNHAFAAGFHTSADTICRHTSITTNNTSAGNNLNYQWNFGDGSVFNGQSPAPHLYPAPGNYDITLTVTNDIGCMDDSIKTITVTDTPTVRFNGLNNQYCTGEEVNLSTNIIGDNVVSYVWDNGNGNIISNDPTLNHTYSNEGTYTIMLSATDRYCGVFRHSESTRVYKIPTFSLGNDITLCPGMQTTIGLMPVTGYTYSWSNGSATSQISTALTTTDYMLTVNNNGCTASDNIVVTVKDHCLIKVPGAFTPNNDGLNDLLKAINADLAKDFLLQVYNRFGQLVFSTRVPASGWDGTFKGVPASAGTYVWQVSYIHPQTGLKVFEKGTSILIR